MSTPPKPFDAEGFSQLYHTYRKPVFLYLLALIRRRGHSPDYHLAEELTQDTFVLLWEKREAFQASPNPIGWLYNAAANLARNHLRTQQRWTALLAQVEPEQLEALPDRRPSGDSLLELEGTIAPEELDLLRRVYLDGASYEELARELGIQPGALAARIHRAKARFRKNFSESEDFSPTGCKKSPPPGHKKDRGGSKP